MIRSLIVIFFIEYEHRVDVFMISLAHNFIPIKHNTVLHSRRGKSCCTCSQDSKTASKEYCTAEALKDESETVPVFDD